jgi:phage gp45-like
MHRQTPANSAMRGYYGGGSIGVVDQVDDTKLLQEMGGNFMSNETRSGVNAPQNYGFTSVVFDAEKDGMGNIQSSAEHFTSFMGANRSFPTAIMDDRRHRMFKLEKGDTAMFRGRGDFQQFHMTQNGGFWTAPRDKIVRMQMVDQDSQSNSTYQQGGGQSGGGAGAQSIHPQRVRNVRDGQEAVMPFDGTSGNGSGGQGQQQKGQEAIYQKGQQSFRFVEVTKDKTRMGGTECHMCLSDGNTYLHCNSDKQVYVGGKAGSGTFDKLVTLSGPCSNSLGKL